MMSIIIASSYAAALCIAQRCVSRLQAKLRPEGPKIEATGWNWGQRPSWDWKCRPQADTMAKINRTGSVATCLLVYITYWCMMTLTGWIWNVVQHA